MTGRHLIGSGDTEFWVDVPTFGGENLMVPVIRAVVRPDGDATHMLLQRRDDPAESVRGSIEIPGGRWRSGESPIDAITREVAEETAVTLTRIGGVTVDSSSHSVIASIRPLVVVAGIEGAFPAVHVVLVADGTGEPSVRPGETRDVRWWQLDEVRGTVSAAPETFIPSTLAAIRAYLAVEDSTGDEMPSI